MIEKEGERKEGSKLWDDVSVFTCALENHEDEGKEWLTQML